MAPRVCHGEATTITIFDEHGGWVEAPVPDGPRVEFWTSKQLEAGEELAFNYGFSYVESLQADLAAEGKQLID